MAQRVVTIGECMVELSQAGDGLLRQGFAGDSFNTAWYLRHRLAADWQVDYLSAVGDDALSDQMLGFMQGAGVGVAHVARLAGRSPGIYLISLHNGERSFTYWRDSSAARHLADDPAAVDRALTGAGLVVFSGITLAILPAAGRAVLIAAIARARGAGAVVAFDPNMRLRLWPDLDALRHWIAQAAACADIVLPSFDEETQVFGDVDPRATIARYRGWGVACVAVKNGAQAIAAWHQRPQMFQPRAQSVVDSTAAGDSFNAGFLAAWMQAQPLAVCLAAGADVAAKVIASRGALVALES